MIGSIPIPTSQRRRLPAAPPPGPRRRALTTDDLLAEIVGPPAAGSGPTRSDLAGTEAGTGTGTPPSIHAVLRARLDRHSAGDHSALAPDRQLNATLGRLVQLITARHGQPAHPSKAARNRAHRAVVGEVGRRLEASPDLARRAADIRTAAALAEDAMERHYTRLALERPPPSPVQRDRLIRLRRLLAPFPYLDNYELLTAGELGALRLVGGAEGPFAFCGAGALPLTGLMLHVMTGAAVDLVEIDPSAAALAGELCRRLEEAGVLVPGRVDVIRADAATLDPRPYSAVVAASLLPRPALVALARTMAGRPAPSSGPASGPVLAVRSAAGLVARFAYEPVPPEAVTATGLHRRGGVVPLSAVSFDDGPATADSEPLTSPWVLGVAPPSVLNRTELYT